VGDIVKIKKKNKKKGFTLLELLAVILVLSMIALIAIPTVTKVIEQSRKGATETTVLNFIRAVNDKIGTSRLDSDKSNDILDGKHDISSIDLHMEGKVPTSGTVTVSGGAVVSADVELNGYSVSCESVEKCIATKDNASKVTYVYYASVGNGITNKSDGLLERPTDKSVYVRYTVDKNDNLTNPEACVYTNGKELCLKTNNYAESKQAILDFIGFNETDWYEDDEIGEGEWFNRNNSLYGCSIYNNNPYTFTACDTGTNGYVATLEGRVETSVRGGLSCNIEPTGVIDCTSRS